MSLNNEEIRQVARIWSRELTGGQVRQVISPADRDKMVLKVRVNRDDCYLEFVLTAAFTRMGRIAQKPATSDAPHPFVMLARKTLGNGSLVGVEQINDDRAVCLKFSVRRNSWSLVAELTSRHANLFLVDADGRIAGSFFPNRSHRRKLVPGELYVPPLKHSRAGGEPGSRFGSSESIEQAIEIHYREVESATRHEREVAQLRRSVTQLVGRQQRLGEKLAADHARAAEGTAFANFGHLLKGNLHAVKKGMTSVAVLDFEGQPVEVPLDPKRSPVENMERYFRRSKKLLCALPEIERRQSRVVEESVWLREFLDALAQAGPERLAELEAEFAKKFPRVKSRKITGKNANSSRQPFKEYAIAHGRLARVGRSAKENDVLTLRFAGPDDLWLHVRGRTGSHVVVPLGRGEVPSSDLLVDAAHLAVHFSDARGEDKVDVLYTRRRYVQKPRGAAPGAVRLLKEKNLCLACEPERLERLLGSGSP